MSIESIAATPDKNTPIGQPSHLTGGVLCYLQALAEIVDGAGLAEAEAMRALRTRILQTEQARAKLNTAVSSALLDAGIDLDSVKGLDMKTGKIELK